MDPRDQFRLLAGMSLVDGRLQKEEEKVLLRSAKGLGLSKEDASAIVRDLLKGGAVNDLAPPQEPSERRKLFNSLVVLILADGVVSPQETACLQRLAPAFGLDPAKVPPMLERQQLLSGEAPTKAQPPPSAKRQPARSVGSISCPSCGAPVEFKNQRSVALVCEYCDTTVVRSDASGALEDVGKISHVVPDASPIRIGSSGQCHGAPFTVLGRLQIEHATGYWNEWYLEWADRRTGWLGEALGMYYVTFPAGDAPGEKAPKDLPSWDELQVGQRVFVANKRYTVTEVRRARATGTEGENPFMVKEGYELPFADLRRPDRGFATIDYSEEPPLVFTGSCVQWKDLNMRNDRRFDGWGR